MKTCKQCGSELIPPNYLWCPKCDCEPAKPGSSAARGSAAFVVEYQAFDAEKRSFGWKELVRYKTRKLADMVVRINKRKCELRVRKLMPQNAGAQRPGAEKGSQS